MGEMCAVLQMDGMELILGKEELVSAAIKIGHKGKGRRKRESEQPQLRHSKSICEPERGSRSFYFIKNIV